MYKSAQVFYVLTSLHWPSQSEIELCKVEQYLYVKTASCHGRNAWKFQAGLQKATGKHRKPYRTVARQVQAFKRGSVSTADKHSNGRCCMSVAVSEKCMDKDRC